jgi:hypothetical protein
MSDLCTHEWKEIKHEGFNRVCGKCNQLKTVLSLADEPRCKGCKLLHAVESSIHPDYCDDCYKEMKKPPKVVHLW